MDASRARDLFGDVATVVVATTMRDGSPHAVPLWFIWRGDFIYISCRRTSATWRNVERDPRIALTFHTGERWSELAGATVAGSADLVVPGHPAVATVMAAWGRKYRGLLGAGGLRRYLDVIEDPGLLRLRPARVVAWDHAGASPPAGAARARAAGGRAGGATRRGTGQDRRVGG